MADYPSFPQWDGTKLVLRMGAVERIATNGKVRTRLLYSAPKYDPIVLHGFLSASDVATLRAFYASNMTTTFNFTATEDGVVRTCMFQPHPFDIEPQGGVSNLFKATVYLREA